MSTTTELRPGIYRIVVANRGESECLTRHGENGVTIHPLSTTPDHNQEWRIVPRADGNILIEVPSKFFPASYLTYQHAPEKPKKGDRILYHVSEFPPNEWHIAIAPGFRSFIRVAGSALGIKVAPQKIHPPFLDLGIVDQLQWVFEYLRPSHE